MLETHGDLWTFRQYGWLVVPTNLTVRRDGLAVMGRGVARQASAAFWGLREYYGSILEEGRHGIEPVVSRPLRGPALKLVLFPVKRHWSERADLELVARNARELVDHPLVTGQVFLPLVGCGFGELEPEEVMPILSGVLSDRRFVLVHRGPGVEESYPSSFVPGVRIDRTLAKSA